MRIVYFLFYIITSCFCAIQFSERPRNFSIELVHYTQLEAKGHVVISPFGIWSLMTGVSLGAVGESYNELARAFLFPNDRNELVNGYKELTAKVLNPKSRDVTLTSKNFMFLDSSLKIFPEFRRTIENDFDSSIDVLDFNDPRSVDIANRKIEKSGVDIKNVLQSNDFTESRMVLANVINFKGGWSTPFNVSETKEEIFYDEKENPIGRVNMMYQNAPQSFSNIKSMEAYALELPYGNDKKYSILFLLPCPNVKVTDVYKKLINISIKEIFAQLDRDYEFYYGQDVEVKIPRFLVSSNIVMNRPLNHMGVYEVFEADRARFDKMTNEDVFISAIVHKANIEVTETGTVASAATVANFVDKTTASKFTANRPFIYFLMEKSTLTMLFGGIYSKPTLY